MQIKALPNGAAAWHGAVPESRAGQRSEGYRSSTQAAAWKLNWNSWVPNTPGADLCEESSAGRRPRAAVTAQTLKLNLTLDDKQEISHKCDPISSERTIQVQHEPAAHTQMLFFIYNTAQSAGRHEDVQSGKKQAVSGNQDDKVLHNVYSTNPENWRSQLLLMSNGALHVHDTSSQSSGNTTRDFLKLGFCVHLLWSQPHWNFLSVVLKVI